MIEKIEVDKDEYNWLVWFCGQADFGPAHGDAMIWYMQRYESETGDRVPERWREGYLTEMEKYSSSEWNEEG